MKYIRTKNKWLDDFEGSEIVKEVYQIYDVKKGDDMNLWAFTFEGFPYCITEEMIIDQADTIEELCDGFVIIDEDNEPNIKQGRDIDHCRRIWAINKCLIYGAIWTDKGLIYVAKMNDKGELELLWQAKKKLIDM